MYGSQSSGPPSLRGRQSSSAFTPTNRTRPSRLPTSAAKTSAGRTRNDPARFSYVGSSVSSAAPSSAIKRVSSFFKTPAKQMGFKDTRNLLDREVQAAMQRKVLNFLAAADYPQLNDRLLRCPTKAEFAQMFEFIVAQLDHHYSLEGKIEEEMPRLMRNLGYPVQLKPSTMQTIGATHTMPHLLGAITWLIDAINFADKISPQEMLLSSEDDGGQRRSLAYGYTIRCYKALGDLPGNAVDHSVLERESERLANILEENDELESATEELAAREEAANEEMAEIQKLVGDSQKLEVELATSKDDYAKVMEYQNELKAGIVNAQGKQDVYSAKLTDLEARLAKIKMDNAAKEAHISKQKMSGETARQLRAQKDELNNELEQLKSEMARTDNDIYDQRKLAFREGIELRERYANFIRNFGNVGRCFGVKDDAFETTMQLHSPNEPDFINFLEDVRKHIMALDEGVKRMLVKMEEEEAGVLEEIKGINQQKETLKEEMNKLQRIVEVKEHDRMLKREDWADEVHKVKLELDVAQNELSALHAARSSKANSHEELAEMKKLVQNRKIAIAEARNRLVHEASGRLEQAFELWDLIKECRVELRNGDMALRSAIERFTAPDD